MAINPDKNAVEQGFIARLIGKIKRIAIDMGDSVTAETARAQAAEGLKADKVQGATAGNLAALDANGNITDSGSKAADFKTKQTPVASPNPSGNSGLNFIDSVSQNENGEVVLHKNTVQSASTTYKGVVQLSNAIDSTSQTEAATPKAVKDAYDELNNKIVARAVFLSQAEWAVQSQLPGDPAKVYYVENGTGEDAYTVYVWKESTSTYEEVDESSIDLDGYWHDGPTTTGNGNVVTNITLGNDGVPQIEKGLTALTQHQDISGKQNVVSTDTDSSAFGDDTAIATGFSSDKLHLNVASRLWNYIRGKILGWYEWTRVDSGTGRYAKICSIADPASGTSYTVDVLVTHMTSYYAVTGLVRITVSHGSSSVQASILASDSLFYAVDSGNPPKVYTYVDGNGKRTFVFDTASAYQTAQGFVFRAVGGFSDKWSFFGDVGCSNDAADLGSIGTKQNALDVTFVFATYAKTAGHAETATNYASSGGIADALAGKSNTSHAHDDRYVLFDTNSQGLTDTQKSNARTNIGAGTSSLTLGTTTYDAARGNHAHGLLDRDGYFGGQNWAVSNLDRLVIAKNIWNGKEGYLVPSALYFDSDEKNKALTQSAEWKEFLQPNGNGSGVSVTPDGTSTGTDIGNSTTLKVWAQKFKNLVSGLGRAAYKNTPMNGLNASSSEVVMGNDTRLTDARTPTSHASTGTTYGAGTTANYGHVKLLNGDLNGISYANGVAAASAHTHSQYLTSHQDISGKVDYTLNNDASVIGNNAPAADCKTYWSSLSMPDNRVKVLYNVPGNEATILFSKRSSYGSILKYGYADRYLYLLRNQSGTWKSTDWEKIYAGYADSAQYAVGASNYDADGNIYSRFSSVDSAINSVADNINTIWSYALNGIFGKILKYANVSGGESFNFDSAKTPGVYVFNNASGYNPGPVTGHIILIVLSNATSDHTRVWQIALSSRISVRKFGGSSWSSWKDMITF